MESQFEEEYYVVKIGKRFLFTGETFNDVERVNELQDADRCTYERADKLAQLYGGKVKKVVTYIEDTEAYPNE